MYIQKINLITNNKLQHKNYNSKKSHNENSYNNYAYNPIAYKDYNISFGDRLFRTPENFYEQPFNRNNMPDTMAKYLFEDYNDRSHIPPAQMMKIVFNDLNNAKSVEEVKELFPEEPLFANLHSMDNKKYREGLLAEIRYLKEPDKSLFKNGKDDLGLYILKKIYLEGKTLKEINKDFKKDISVVYSGISDISYRDLANLGIKFPNNSFWHSFYVTREDFPYVPLKKKDAEFHAKGEKKELTLADINKGDIEGKKTPKFKIKDYEVKDISGAMTDNFGDIEKTNRNLKKKLKSDDPKLTFIQKYMGEIMSISLDRVHASDEMRMFFENYENIEQSSRARMKKYWDSTPEMKALQGLVMSDTIKLFFEYYGADGNNELFKDLIDYANSIKPEREQRLLKHEEKQKYYDELAKELPISAQKQESEPINNKEETDVSAIMKKASEAPDSLTQEEIQIMINMQENEYKDKMEFYINGEKYTIYSNLEEELTKCVNINFDHILAKPYYTKYAKYLNKSNLADDKFKFTIISNNSKYDYSAIKSELYDNKTLDDITDKINFNFMKKYPLESRAAHQAFVDTMCKFIPEANENLAGYIYKALPLDIPALAAELQDQLAAGDNFMNERYYKYLEPVTNKEGKEIAEKICKGIMSNYEEDKSILFKNKSENSLYIKIFSLLFEGDTTSEQKQLKNTLSIYIKTNYGGTAKALLDKDLPNNAKLALSEQIIHGFIMTYTNDVKKAITKNEKVKEYLIRHTI